MTDIIKPEGWHNWGKPDAEETTFYAEYQSVGAGASAEKRVSWSHQLKKQDIDNYTLENVFDNLTPNLSTPHE